jgi:hypothetical protein
MNLSVNGNVNDNQFLKINKMNTLKKSSKKNKLTTKNKVADTSTGTPQVLSDDNKKQIADVLDSTKKIIHSIKAKLDQQEIEDALIPELERAIEAPAEVAAEVFAELVSEPVAVVVDINTNQLEIPTIENVIENNVVLAEELLDTIENTENSQLEMNMDFDVAQEETSNEMDAFNTKSMLEKIQGSFEETKLVTINNTKELVNFYTQNANLALNINQQLVDSINSQIELLLNLKN